ncbi:MAG: sigma-E processing peptidase SpoIIGA [Clostridiales bacterium]|jgi:stage II sporulation protein GA (sporulation sigma-E factor processing peptidase)|nr:sigma-E processing peptidase SpoIIGA [Clostridiales bacterium]
MLEVYADVVFFINFVMDFIILWVAGRIARQKTKVWRVAAAAGIMALLYCLIVFVTRFHIFYHMISTVAILMIGVFAAFSIRKPKTFFKLILLAYVSAFFIGGLGMALFYGTQFSNLVGNITNATVKHFSLATLSGAVAGFYLLFKAASVWLDRRALKRQMCLAVKIFFEGRNVEFNALVDTGNTLREPLSQAPVIVAEFNSVKHFLPDPIKLIFYENQEGDLRKLISGAENDAFSTRMRMIPFESLGRPHGVLIGFRPDKVEILREKDVITPQNVIIGIYNFHLSKNGAYQGLLNPELMG